MAGEYLLINPRKRHRRKKRAVSRRKRRTSMRHNPVNPRRRRRRHHVHARRHMRRNPRAAGMQFAGVNVGGIALAGAGFVGAQVASGWLAKMLPADWQANPLTRIGIKAAVGVGAPILLRRFIGRGVSNWLAIGGGVAVVADLWATYAAPALGLSDYEQGGITGYEQGYLSEGEGAEDMPQLSGVYSGDGAY